MKILAVLIGFTLGGAAVIGAVIALDQAQAGATPMSMRTGTPSALTASMSMQTKSVSRSALTALTIQHVQKGCHVFANGSRQSAAMRLTLKRGAGLKITDQDIDPHGLVQLAGPRLNFSGHMMMGQQQTIMFKTPGHYRLKTRVVEMGKMANVKTIGPDNVLRLTVTVT
jgi:hypothetical protein